VQHVLPKQSAPTIPVFNKKIRRFTGTSAVGGRIGPARGIIPLPVAVATFPLRSYWMREAPNGRFGEDLILGGCQPLYRNRNAAVTHPCRPQNRNFPSACRCCVSGRASGALDGASVKTVRESHLAQPEEPFEPWKVESDSSCSARDVTGAILFGRGRALGWNCGMVTSVHAGSMGTHPGRYRSRKRDSPSARELFGDRAP